jgi:predicted TIM-barrel fold metal-dependent hydrolase
MPRIDAHGHVFTRASAEFPREVSPLVPADKEETVETLLTYMDNNLIDQAVLVQIGGTTYEHHAYLKHCLQRYPQKFQGIGLVPEALRQTPEEHMDRLTDGTGLVGFRLNTVGGPRDPFDPIDVRTFDTFRIWQHAAEKDYVLWLYVSARDAHLIAYLVDAFPQVRVVLNHLGICPGEGTFSHDQWGRPQVDAPSYNPAFHTTHRLSAYENVTLHLSGQYAFSKDPFPYNDLAPWHQKLLKSFGADRLMWATDFPWIYEHPGYDKLTTIIETSIPEIQPHELEAIMGGTARRFLRFPDID